MTEKELVERAGKEDIRVYGLSEYRIRKDREEKPTILLGYANLTEEQIREALGILNRCFR